MRWFTTLLLTVLVVGGALWLLSDGVRRMLGLSSSAPPPSPTLVVLHENVTPALIRKIERIVPDQETLVLLYDANAKEWTQPGNWPVRQSESQDLAATLEKLATRFQPIPLAAGADLKLYGLDPSQKPVELRVDAATKSLKLLFGQAPATAGDSAFARTTYLRLDDQPEVLRLGPDVFAAVTKPADAYRRRQLFPDVTRVKLTGGEPPANPMAPAPPATGRAALPTDKAVALKVESPAGAFAVKRTTATPAATPDPDRPSAEPSLAANRIASVWELTEIAAPGQPAKPFRDRIDPVKLRGLLTAIPELWAEQFVTGKPDAVTGLDKPERTLTISFANNTAATLRIGKLSRRVIRDGAAPPAQPFAPQPPPQPKVDEYYYAKLDNNPLVFEIRGDKFNDLFAAADDLRDPSLARFESGDVTELTVARKGQPPIKITKKKGNKDAEKDEDKQDRWYLDGRLAEAPRVTELLDALGRLEARVKEDRIDDADAKKLADLGFDPAATKVTVVTEDKAGAKSETAFVIGKADAEKKKLHVQMAGWPRVNVVADDVLKQIDRPALAYRGRRLFDTAEAKLVGVIVAGAEPFAIKQNAEKKWQITQPVAVAADDAKASQLTGDLSRIEVVEYLDDAPKPEDVEKKYGLAKPALSLKLTFEGNKEQTLDIGTSPEFKEEYYARLGGAGGVFTLPKATVDSIKAGAAGLLPLQLWSVAADKVVAIEIERPGGEKYKLAPEGGNWKLTGPFDAPVPFLSAQPLVTAASVVMAQKYESLAADLAKFGLDKPAVKVTVTYKEMKGDKEETLTKTVAVSANAVPATAGVPGETNLRYAVVDGGKAVFTMPDTLVKEADKSALDRLDKTLFMLDMLAIKKIVLAGSTPESAVNLLLEKDGWKAEGKPFALDSMTILGLQNNVARPVVQRLAAYGSNLNVVEYGLDKPEHTVTVTMADGKTHTIKIGKTAPGGGRFARADDGPAIGVLSDGVAKTLTRGPLDFVDRTLFKFDAAQLAGLTRKEGTDVLEIVPSATAGWEIAQPAKLKADQATMDELADQLGRLRLDSVAAYAPDDLEPFGLSKPLMTVTLKVGLEKPEDKVLKIGLETDDGKTGDRYATIDGKTVGVLSGSLIDKLTAAPLKFRDRTLAKFVDADRATVVRGDRTVTFAKVNGTWKLVKPVSAEAEQAELDELINAAAKLRADELAAEKPANLAVYGLDKPEAVWTFAAGDKEVLKLSLGTREKNGQRAYAKAEGTDIVALLDPVLTSRLLAEYRKRSAWTGVDAAQVDAVAISSGTVNFSLKKAGMTWTDPDRPGEAINAAAVTELLDALAGLKATRYAADEKADLKLYGLEPPQRVIVVTGRGGAKTLHLGREEGAGGGRIYARVADKDRTDVFILSEADAVKLLKDRGAYSAKK